jgi:hypothetical protein
MKFIIKNSDLFLSGKLIPEGTEIELTKEQTKGIESFLQSCHSERSEESASKSPPAKVYAEHSRSIEGSNTKIKSKGNKK